MTQKALQKRRWRLSFRLRQLNRQDPRLVVFRSNKQTYAQVIDDTAQKTLASASSLNLKEGSTKTEKAKHVGDLIAQRALEAGATRVIFDRRGRKYHGRIKALAEAAREKGLTF